MEYYELKKDEYLLSTDPSKLQVDMIHSYLSKESYWALNIPKETVERSIKNSMPFGLYANGQQVGFARLVTDRTIFAYLADVFILPAFRGKGLSKWMIKFIQSHPELQGLRRWMLATRDAHGLYEQFGWTTLDEEAKKRLMHRHNKNVYQ